MRRGLVIYSWVVGCFLAVSTFGEIIPSNRLTAWRDNVGVPGGIPARTTVYATISPSLGDGVTDAWPAISSAINSVPAGQVVKLPDGVFKVGQTVRPNPPTKKNFTIRGNGPGRTIVKYNAPFSAFYFGAADWPYPTNENAQAITAGATTGSKTVTVANTSAFAVGNLCHVSQNSLSYVIGTDAQPQTITFKVMAKTAKTVTLNHPLPCDFPNSPILVPYPTAPVEGVGLEDLTIDCQDTATFGVGFEQSYGCWIKNVEIMRSINRQMLLIVFNQGEVRHCYTHDTYTAAGPNHEGIDLYNRSCWNLIEDNIADNGGFPGIMLGDSHGGCSGNVIGYNFCKNAATATDTAGADISFNHGAHNNFNLAEGNIVGNGISSDGYFGSSSHNTIFRNWAWAKPYTTGRPNTFTTRTGLRAIQLNRMSNYHNVVGNILGDSSFSRTPGSGGGNYGSEVAGYPERQLIYELGFPNLGNKNYNSIRPATNPPSYLPPEGFIADQNAYQQLDLNVKNTLLRHGNYDYFTRSIVWDPSITDHTLPNSYYLADKPAWFGALKWPPLDPTTPSDTAAMTVPAQYRFVHGIDPPLRVVSRKVHGNAGTFDIDLPLTGVPGIECRSGGPANEHKIIATFAAPITSADAAVIMGSAFIKGDRQSGVSVNGADVTIELTDVANAQTIELEITGASNGANFDVTVPMRVLLGDTTGNGSVNSTDVTQTKPQAGIPANASNFREDITVNGVINSSDVSFVKSKSGTASTSPDETP